MDLSSTPSLTSTAPRRRGAATTGHAALLLVALAIVGLGFLIYLVLTPAQVSQEDFARVLEPLPPSFDVATHKKLLEPLREIGTRPSAEGAGRSHPFQ